MHLKVLLYGLVLLINMQVVCVHGGLKLLVLKSSSAGLAYSLERMPSYMRGASSSSKILAVNAKASVKMLLKDFQREDHPKRQLILGAYDLLEEGASMEDVKSVIPLSPKALRTILRDVETRRSILLDFFYGEN